MEQESNKPFHKSDALFASLIKYRKALFIISLCAAIVSGVVSVLIPSQYKATTVLFTSVTNNTPRSIIDPNYESKDYIAFGDDKNCEQMMQIVKSADVMYAMAKKYNLYEHYGIENYKDKDSRLRGEYADNFEFEITEYQSIKITVFDRQPVMAYMYANGIVQVADSVYRQVILQRASTAFNIVKQQYDSSRIVLKNIEDSMDFYRKKGVLSFDYQVKELTKGYVDAQIKGNPADVKLMDDKLNLFATYGRNFSDIANELNDQYKWMQQIKQSYLEAKINLDKIIPPFFVAEKAVIPDKRTFPIRWLIVVISTLAAFFFGFIFLLISEKINRREVPSLRLNPNPSNTSLNP